MYSVDEAKKYLNKIGRYNVFIECKSAEVNDLYDKITSITCCLREDVGNISSNPDKVGNGVAKLVDLKNRIAEEIARYASMRREIVAMIEGLENPRHYEVLHKRYVLRMSFKKIARDMKCSSRNAQYLHDEAMKEFVKLMERKQAS